MLSLEKCKKLQPIFPIMKIKIGDKVWVETGIENPFIELLTKENEHVSEGDITLIPSTKDMLEALPKSIPPTKLAVKPLRLTIDKDLDKYSIAYEDVDGTEILDFIEKDIDEALADMLDYLQENNHLKEMK